MSTVVVILSTDRELLVIRSIASPAISQHQPPTSFRSVSITRENMHFLILGATGKTGVHGYKLSLEQGELPLKNAVAPTHATQDTP